MKKRLGLLFEDLFISRLAFDDNSARVVKVASVSRRQDAKKKRSVSGVMMILQRETPSAFGALLSSNETRPSADGRRRRKGDTTRRSSSLYAQTLRCPSAAISSTLSVSTSPVAYRTFAVRARWFRDTTSALYHIPSSGQYSCFVFRVSRVF